MSINQNQQLVQAPFLPEDFLRTTIRRLMPSWRDDIADFCYLDGGYSNVNYRFRHGAKSYVLRTPIPVSLVQAPATAADASPKPGGTIANLGLIVELQLRSQLPPDADLCIAPLVAADLGQGQMITGFVEGPVLAERLPSAGQAARYLRHLHQQLLPVVQVDRYALGEQVEQWMPQPPGWLEAYLANTDDQALLAGTAGQCCHNDLNPWNVIVNHPDASRWTSLDWETAKLAHPVFDAVCLHQGIALEMAQQQAPGESPRRLDLASSNWISLADFCTQALAAPVSAELLQAALRSFWVREYAWALAQRREGNPNPSIAVQMDCAEQQLKLQLASV